MITKTDTANTIHKNECINKKEIQLVVYYKFKLVKRLNENIIEFLEKSDIKDISIDLLEEIEYYFDEMIHEYNEIKPLMKKLRTIRNLQD